MPQARAIRNALTIDVEDYFQVSAFAPHIRRSEWEGRECRIERNMERVLALLDERGISATEQQHRTVDRRQCIKRSIAFDRCEHQSGRCHMQVQAFRQYMDCADLQRVAGLGQHHR